MFTAKMVILPLLVILSTTKSWSQSNASEATSARAKGNIRPVAELQDSLEGFRGKIVDSIKNEPIPFVTITFYKDSGSMTIVSDVKGEFSTTLKHLNPEVLLSAIGYKPYVHHLISHQINLLRLAPESNSLKEVIVSSKVEKKLSASRIVKKVNKNMEKNFGDFSYDQKFKAHSVAYNYDTVKSKINDLLTTHFYKDRALISERKRQSSDTTKYDASFFKFIGVPELFLELITDRTDILRIESIIGEKTSKNFDFQLLAHYQDEKYGSVYRISFKPHSQYYSFFWGRYVDIPLGYFKGEMLVNKNDYAVVNVKYTWDMEAEHSKKFLEDLYHSPYWKADKVGKIVFNSLVYSDEYSYVKDTATGKYFVQTLTADCFETGYQIENDQNVQLHYLINLNSLGIENMRKE